MQLLFILNLTTYKKYLFSPIFHFMKAILIADAGSTKIDWALIFNSKGNRSLLNFRTPGLNPASATDEEIDNRFTDIDDFCSETEHPDMIYYYGAGCATPQICQRIENKFHSLFPEADIYIASDMEGAAKAILGDRPGIACILGTGSNSALYDGSKIMDNIPPLGYILGDEGSGASLGKRLIADYFKRQLSPQLSERLESQYNLSLNTTIEAVYRQPAPSRWLARFAPFMADNITDNRIRAIITDEFRRFFERNVCPYPDASNMTIGFCGSIATYFSEILKETARPLGFKIEIIKESPIERLTHYYSAI